MLVAEPTSTDALLAKALTLLGPERTDAAGALAMTNRILEIDPQNANALQLQASIALSEDRLDDAEALLTRLGSLPRPTASFLIGPPEQMRGALDARRRTLAGPSSTTTPGSGARSSTSTVPGAPTVPNPGGG